MAKYKKIILASKSPSRAAILKNAEVPFEVLTVNINEDILKKEGLKKGQIPAQIAINLARQKANAVSEQKPQRFVLGGDQILVCRGEIFDKPRDMAAARETLIKLRGQTHTLISAACIFLDGKQVLEAVEEAHLTMQNFSDEFLEGYLARTGEKILASVGAYQLEAEGAELFTCIEGDFFTVLGLPLNPVLEFCRQQGIIKGG